MHAALSVSLEARPECSSFVGCHDVRSTPYFQCYAADGISGVLVQAEGQCRRADSWVLVALGRHVAAVSDFVKQLK